MRLNTLLIKRAEENKDKIVHKQSVKLVKYLMKELRKKVRLGYTFADVYPPAKYLFITHFDETLRVTKAVLEEEGILLRFISRTAFRDPCFEVSLMMRS